MNTTKKSLIGVAALLALASMQAACGSDDSSGGGTTAGAGGSHAGAGGAATTGGGGAATTGGAPAGGAPTGGAPAGGTGGGAAAGTGGTTGGTGGAAAGTGGTTGGTGGTGGGAAGAGGSSPTFAAVKTLIGMNCGTGGCHNKNSGQLDFQGTTDLYAMLTTALPDGTAHCKGSILAVANDSMSLLARITDPTNGGSTMCSEGGQMKTIARMPDDCKTTSTNPRACLSDAQHKVITDWLAAGAPK